MSSVKSQKSGFTLIELLVVIAVIGMLASIVLVSLGPVRAKARDAKRIAEVRQMALVLEQEAADEGEAIGVCTADQADVTTCTIGGVITFANFKDPSSPTTPLCKTAGDTGTTCQYSIATNAGAINARTNDYQICFKLEQGVGTAGLLAGLNQIETGANFKTGCE